jgi:mannose-6-phosphate isomerase-like protein (cupin superfamily)
MTEQLLHLGEHETLRIVRNTPEVLEVEGTWTPGGSPPPAHLHPSQDEQFEVRTGRLTAIVDGNERKLEPSDTLRIPRGTPHKMYNANPEPATAVWRTRPAGRTAEWFATVDRLSKGGTQTPSGPALAKAVISYGDVFRLAVVPLPLRPLVQVGLRVLALADRR